MGNRCNWGLRQHDGNILYIYSHWGGDAMFAQFANALSRAHTAGRLPGDEAYANRIIISALISDHDSDLGWGVTINQIADNEHKIPVYDYATDTVSLYDYSWENGKSEEPIFTVPRVVFIHKYAKSLVGV